MELNNIKEYDNLVQKAYTHEYDKNIKNPNEENDILLQIDKKFYLPNSQFNVIRHVFKKHLDMGSFDIEKIYLDRNSYRVQLQILSRRISNLILQKSLVYSRELLKVQTLQEELKLAVNITKNSRISIRTNLTYLSRSAMQLVKNLNKKNNINIVLNQYLAIQKISHNNVKIQEELNQKNFCLAIRLCLETRKEIMKYSYFHCLSELNSRIQDALDMIEEQIDQTMGLTTTCHFDLGNQLFQTAQSSQNFSKNGLLNETFDKSANLWSPNGLYDQIYLAQKLLGKSHTALDQLQMHYATSIHNYALSILKSHIIKNLSTTWGPDIVATKSIDECNDDNENNENVINNSRDFIRRAQYPELCYHISGSQFLECLEELLTKFFDIYACYYHTVKWYQNHYSSKRFSESSDSDAKDQMESSLSDQSILEDDLNKNYVAQKLKHGVMRVDQDIQQKVSVYLDRFTKSGSENVENPKFDAITLENFITYLISILRFVQISQSFSGNQISEALHSSIYRFNRSYLHYYHSLKLEEIKMFLENETWATCPVKRNFKLADLQEFKFLKKHKLKSSHLVSPKSTHKTSSNNINSLSNNDINGLCLDFNKYLDISIVLSDHTKNQNDFSRTKENGEADNANMTQESTSESENYEKENCTEGQTEFNSRHLNNAPNRPIEPLSTIMVGGDEGNRMVDPSALARPPPPSQFWRLLNKQKSQVDNFVSRKALPPILTNTALSILRLSGKYIYLLDKGGVSPTELIPVLRNYIANLYDMYLFTVYQIVIGKFHYQMVGYLLSSSLLTHIEKIGRECFAAESVHDFPNAYNPFLTHSHNPSMSEIAQNDPNLVKNHVKILTNGILNNSNTNTYLNNMNDRYKINNNTTDNNKNNYTPGYNYPLIDRMLSDYLISTESLLYLNTKLSNLLKLYSNKLSSPSKYAIDTNNNDNKNNISDTNDNTSGDYESNLKNPAFIKTEVITENFKTLNEQRDNPTNLELENHQLHSPLNNIDPNLPTEIQRLSCYILSLYVIDYNTLIGMITGPQQNWDMGELAGTHSTYVNYIIQAFKNIALHLSRHNGSTYTDDHQHSFKIPNEFRLLFWQNLVSITFRTLVDGFALIKKCSNEGRALMQLDFQHLLLYIDDIVSLKEIPDKDFVENYIKAYYLPESEIDEWITNHQEYSLQHLTALVSSMPQLTKKTRTRLIATLEDTCATNNPNP